MTPIQFVVFEVDRTLREKELVASRARAHAARVSHQRPRQLTYPITPYMIAKQAEATGKCRQLAFNPWQMSHGYRHDAFNIIPGINEGVAARAFDFLISYMTPSAEAINHAYRTANLWNHLIFVMSRYTDFFHAATAVLAACNNMAVTESSSLGFNNLTPEILYHHGQAISRLRKRLSEPGADADDASILTILFLSIFDRGIGDISSLNIHLDQIGRMIKVRGGLEQMSSGNGLRDTLLQFGQISAPSLEAVPFGHSVEPEAFESTRISPPIRQEAIDALPDGFRRMARKGALSESTIIIAARMATYPAREGNRFAPLNIDSPAPAFFPEGAGLFEKLVCLALIRHKVNETSRIRHSVCPYEDVALTLTRELPDIEAPRSRPERDTLLWCWLVTIDAWSVGTRFGRLAPRGMELLVQLREKFPETRCWKLRDFEALGKRFFWRRLVPRWLRPSWESVKSQSGAGLKTTQALADASNNPFNDQTCELRSNLIVTGDSPLTIMEEMSKLGAPVFARVGNPHASFQWLGVARQMRLSLLRTPF